MRTSRELDMRDMMQKTIDTLAAENEQLQARVDELEAEVKWWRGRVESGATAKHWPEFGPSGR